MKRDTNIIALSISIIILFSSHLPAQTYRDSLDVVRYNIHLKIDPYTQSLKGYTEITLTSKYDLNKIGLDLWGLYIDSILIKGQKITNYRYTSVNFYFPYNLNALDTITLKVFYHGNPHKDNFWGGFYFKNLYAFNYGIGLRSNPPSLGRCWFPANDIFTDKALFEFHITTDSTRQAICNGLLIDTTKHNYWITWHWKLNEPIPPYLANVAVGKYKKFQWTYHGIKKDIPVSIYLMKKTPDTAIKSLKNLDKVMNVFEHLFGAYQWERVGYIQVPMVDGAMEHATNISMPLYSFDGTLREEPLFVHELAHSWFGNLVTCQTPADIWLNEGWAEYASILYSQYVYDEKEFKKRMRENHFIVLNFVHKDDNGYKAIGNIQPQYTYGKTIYKKGADVVHTLRYQIGDSLFWSVVQSYLKTFAFGNVSIKQMRVFFEKHTGMDLKNWFDYWIYTPGFPHFSVNNMQVKKKKGKYIVIVQITQRTKESDKYLKDQRMQIGFVGKGEQFSVKETFITGKLTTDTFYLPFRPQLAVLDPNEHITDATTKEFYWLKDTGTYIFDYELFDLYVNAIDQPVFFRVKANWIAPENTLIQNHRYLLNSTYYWTIQNNADEKFSANGKFYLSSLLDYNFLQLNQRQLKGLTLFYRKDRNHPWQIVPAKLSPDYQYFELKNIQAGDYIIGLDRTIK